MAKGLVVKALVVRGLVMRALAGLLVVKAVAEGRDRHLENGEEGNQKV